MDRAETNCPRLDSNQQWPASKAGDFTVCPRRRGWSRRDSNPQCENAPVLQTGCRTCRRLLLTLGPGLAKPNHPSSLSSFAEAAQDGPSSRSGQDVQSGARLPPCSLGPGKAKPSHPSRLTLFGARLAPCGLGRRDSNPHSECTGITNRLPYQSATAPLHEIVTNLSERTEVGYSETKKGRFHQDPAFRKHRLERVLRDQVHQIIITSR